MIEKRIGGHLPGAAAQRDTRVSFSPTGASDRVGNFSCAVYRTVVEGRHVNDSCMADVEAAGISAADRASLHQAFARLEEMTRKMSGGLFRSPVSAMPTDKFPVLIVHYDEDGKADQSVQLERISTSAVAASDFAIPAGYAEQDLSGLGHER